MENDERKLTKPVQALLHRLVESDVDTAALSAATLADMGAFEAIPALRIALSSVTVDATVRNAVAIALSDLKDDGMVPLIGALLLDPRTKGNRGTLLYAIESFDNRSLLRELTQLVLTGGFEVRHQAFQNIASIRGPVDWDIWQDRLSRVNAAVATAPKDRVDLLRDLLDLLDDDTER
jgi:HEAT repeat protein